MLHQHQNVDMKTIRDRRLMNVVLLLASLAVGAIFLEFSIRVLVHYGAIAVPPPMPVNESFYDGNHPVFGVWRHPGASVVQWSPCFRVEYRTNNMGALDRERSPKSDQPRVVVLGDSFVEGWGLPTESRASNLLEKATGWEHLNFAMAHFGPYQSYLVYRDLAKKFDHDHVLIGVTPVNDFVDLDYEAARDALAYEYRYRPYLVGEYPDYQPYDFRESGIQRFARRHAYSYNALNLAWHRIRGVPDSEYDRPLKNKNGFYHSYYYDFSEKQFNLLRYSLELLLNETNGKRVALFLIPAQRDFARYEQQPHATRLEQRLKNFAVGRNLDVIDLMPGMFQAGKWRNYFFSCDYHWNEHGNAVATDILKRELTGYFYKQPADTKLSGMKQ